MEYRIRTDLARSALVVGLGVAVSFIVSAAVAARAYRGRGEDTVDAERTLSVKGLARKRIQSDVAVWRIEVKGEGETLRAAYDALDSGLGAVRRFLGEQGFPDDEIALGAIDTDTHYRRDGSVKTREIAGYTLERRIRVMTADVDRVAGAAGEVTGLIRNGVLVVSSAPEYYFSGLAGLKIELMGLASSDARHRAEEIASHAGSRIGAVRSARMGVLQITQPHSTETSSYGIYDTDTITKDVRAVVSVTFGVG